MTKNLPQLLILISITMMLVVAGCATPEEVRSLAGQTAANTAALSIATGETAQASRRVAERRAANIARLQRETTAVRSRVEFDKILMEQIGDSATLSLFKKLQDWSTKVEEHEAQAAFDEAAFSIKVLESRAEIDGKSKSLKEIAGILAALAEEEKGATRAIFYGQFVLEVLDDVDEQRKISEQSSKLAEDKLNETQDDANGG